MTLPSTLETRTRLRADSSSDDRFSTGGIGFLLLQHAPRTRQHQLSPAHRTIASASIDVDRHPKRSHPCSAPKLLAEKPFRSSWWAPFGRRSAPNPHPPSRAKDQRSQVLRRI